MSRTTRNINRIRMELDKISGLDGIAGEMVEKKADEIEKMVKDILENHSEANLFDYEGAGDKEDDSEPVTEVEEGKDAADDLISRKDVLTVLENIFEKYKIAWTPDKDKVHGRFASAVLQAVMEISCAFNVNECVDQLETSSMCEDYPVCNYCQKIWCPLELIEREEAVDIVKGCVKTAE